MTERSGNTSISEAEQEKTMNESNNFWTGPHHFWCGLIFGAGVGAWIGWQMFDGGWGIVATLVIVALVVAYSCGRWGDRFWRWLIENLWWFT